MQVSTCLYYPHSRGNVKKVGGEKKLDLDCRASITCVTSEVGIESQNQGFFYAGVNLEG